MSHLAEIRITHCFHLALLRAPSLEELSYWLGFLRAGGSDDQMWTHLTRGYEFEAEAKVAFRGALGRTPTEGELDNCRKLVAAGTGLAEAVKQAA